jgi:hypothetical protein
MCALITFSPPARLRSWVVASLAALALSSAPGCSPAAAQLTPKEVEAHGVVVVRGPPDKVLEASIDALKLLGYEIALERRDKGLIVTKKRSVPDMAVGTAQGTEAVTAPPSYTRQYTLEIRDGGGGTSRVKATPAVFENAADISDKRVWDLESPLGEREMWKQLFAKIEQRL